jgi:hypothetical protein
MARTELSIPDERIAGAILLVRGHKVILDSDLAGLYGVTTKRLNEQVKRSSERFPADFMFQLNAEEHQALRSQIATLKVGRGHHRKYRPYVFTEHGAIMAASVLNSPRAIQVSVHVVRAFVRLREMLATHKDLARKLEELEKKYDAQFQVVFGAIRQLMAPPPPPPPETKKRRIGFHAGTMDSPTSKGR